MFNFQNKKGANKRPFKEGNTELNKLNVMINFYAFWKKND